MAPTSAQPAPHDSSVYVPIPAGPHLPEKRRSSRTILFLSPFILLSFILLIVTFQPRTRSKLREDDAGVDTVPSDFTPATAMTNPPSRGVSQGVSEKGSGVGGLAFPWTDSMLDWQRTGYHFQPEKNWMNDPNGPLLHMGWYHLFYQYNPDAAVWGNISWGHAVSRDLIHWLYLPLALVPDQWYDINGVWTGSATILRNGSIVMLYTGNTKDLVQVQCLAYPANLSDPLLIDWVKHPANPVLLPPPGIGSKDFRDPTTAWLSPDGDEWKITIGSKVNKTGISIVYVTKDFVNYELLDGYLHRVPGTGMWECIDFYPVSVTEENGLDTSANGPGIKHLMKASLDDDKNDYYALGMYDPFNDTWVPDDPEKDVGIGLRYDYGKYYASKTFYDHEYKRRILWGWVRETDAEELDILKGWASVQSIPRTVVFDKKTGSNILQWPVEEVEQLRSDMKEFRDVDLRPGSIIPLKVDPISQLDIVVSFEINEDFLQTAAMLEDDTSYDCPTSGGAANRGRLGPFGIIVLADQQLSELTPIYFYIHKGTNGIASVHFCADELRSSLASDVDKVVYGSTVPVYPGEKLYLRSLVDSSIVESFAQYGRTVITSRLYPTKAMDGASQVFLFNNATDVRLTASVEIWKMNSADIRPFPGHTL